MNINQVEWAKSHDWYDGSALIESSPLVGQYLVFVVETGTQLQADGTSVEYSSKLSFQDFQELRDWAGY